jgi:Putative beta-barrel porin-2, OmpL-like. bbp2
MKRIGFLQLLLLGTLPALAQDSTASDPLSITGYTEIYYQYDFNKPADGKRPGFIYNHNRHNEVNLNLGYLKASYNGKNSRVNLAAAAGTYMNANYSAEPGVLKNILEANAGLRVSKKQNIWLDAGILPSHIGFESAVSKDCPTLTRSLLAENSPYFETGAKLNYTGKNGKWSISGLVLNGWQRITRVAGNTKMSWGTQIQFKPTDKILLNYSTFFGSDKPDSSHQRRAFHNWYGVIGLSDKWGLTLGFDLGREVQPGNQGRFNYWYSPVGIIKYSFHPQWSVAARTEYYDDRNGVIIPLQNNTGFRAGGFSFNLDFTPDKNILLRIEGKSYNSREPVFAKGTQFSRQNAGVILSMAASF